MGEFYTTNDCWKEKESQGRGARGAGGYIWEDKDEAEPDKSQIHQGIIGMAIAESLSLSLSLSLRSQPQPSALYEALHLADKCTSRL